jgi:8-oxo-dGTP diphosphatase
VKPGVIETVALIHIVDGKVLLARPRGSAAFYMPGGKRADGEPHHAALEREVREELDVRVVPDTLSPYGVFEDEAYGAGDGIRVRIHCYLGELDREPVPSGEIEELRQFSYAEYHDMSETAPAVRQILRDLRNRSLIG